MSDLQPRFVDLLDLPDQAALQRHFDGRNSQWLRFYAFVFAGTAVLYSLYALSESAFLSLVAPAANLVLIRLLFWASDKTWYREGFRHYLTGYLLVQLGFLLVYYPSPREGLQLVGFLTPVLLIPFHFELARSLTLYIGLLAAFLAPDVIAAATGEAPLPILTVTLMVLLFALAALLGIGTTRRAYIRFMGKFREESSRHRDRMRMRDELDSARRIQLQMLPQGDPKLPQLDICGVCLPATEVGGDYYEYFPRSDGQIAVVIGDVAGHGVASGLLLSGIRSCLHLLQTEGLKPGEILSRLNRMVRDTNKSRMFISLLYLILDYRRNTIELSSAGHPPLLHYSRDSDRVSEIGRGALPLGTNLGAVYGETHLEFGPGDVLLLLTDGLHETRNAKEQFYGLDRLATRLRESSHKSSRDIREAILGDVWNFKGNAEQEDDITLVVVKSQDHGASSESRTGS